VQLVCLVITLTSILVVLGVVGLVAERLLNSRFDFLQKRPRIPRRDHVVVVGLGRVGRKVTSLLIEFNQPMVALHTQPSSADLATQVPLLIGNILELLPAANLETAKSIIAVTDDQMLNLEVALLAAEKTLNHRFSPVVRTRSKTFSANLSALMPQAQTFCAYALSAEAFAGAAFGENIVGLFRLGGQNILIAEYVIAPGDTLVGKRMGHIAYGYGVVPIVRETGEGKRFSVILPTDDQRLLEGDRLFVLSSINGLRRIERGERTPPRRWRLSGDLPPANFLFNLQNKTAALSEAADVLIKMSSCDVEIARSFVEQLPTSIELELYDYQAARLIQAMKAHLPVRLSPVRE
jgi:Trk K+ transport system NAD-binding subunit